MTAAEYRAGAAKVPTEAQECKWLIEWADAKRYGEWRLSELLVHVPNGAYHGADRKSGAVVARKLREQGLQAGVFDYILPVPKTSMSALGMQFCPGLWLEMKRTRGGVVSTDQQKFMGRMTTLGWQCEIAKGWVEASRIIEAYLMLPSGGKP